MSNPIILNGEKNNNDNISINDNNVEKSEELISKSVRQAMNEILKKFNVFVYDLSYETASLAGENSYGAVLRLEAKSKSVVNGLIVKPLHFILKLSPKNEARRRHMKVAEYYSREIFIYECVIAEFYKLQNQYNIGPTHAFNAAPKLHHYSLANCDEFIIFEDLKQSDYSMFSRQKALTFQHTAVALKELGKFHAMSFVLKETNPEKFSQLVTTVKEDNLFTENIDQISIEFGKKYINRTIKMLKEQLITNKKYLVKRIEAIRDDFKTICLQMVNGNISEPYSVICHGDFWNNNILFKYDKCGTPMSAKILDFQMSRYASPVLDVVHYLFTCTEKTLRDEYFEDMKRVYYESLTQHISLFGLSPDKIFPRSAFENQLRTYGIYGFCMASYAIPFIISDSIDIPDLDEVAEAITLQQPNSSDIEDFSSSETESDKSDRTNAILEEFELLTEKSIPIFKRRMTGIVLDMDKYKMLRL